VSAFAFLGPFCPVLIFAIFGGYPPSSYRYDITSLVFTEKSKEIFHRIAVALEISMKYDFADDC
jgi:hypothetical protein